MSEFVITCMRISDRIFIGWNKGIEALCLDCGQKVWLSDSTMTAAKELNPDRDFTKEPPIIYCIECTMKKMKEGDVIIPPTADQKKEIDEGIKKLKE